MEWRQKNATRYAIGYGILIMALAALAACSLSMGSVSITPGEALSILLGRGGSEIAQSVIWRIRFPRLLAACLLGGALSVSGFLLQTFFANPIAGPFVLGISSGAKLTVALTMILFLQRGVVLSAAVMILAAFAGSTMATGLILLFSRHIPRMSALVICGVMIGYLCTAATDFIVTFAEDSNIVNLHNWSMGSFSGISWAHVRVITVVTLAGVGGAVWLSKPMGAYQMGEAYAQNMGVNLRSFRLELILLSSLLSACVTAFAGPISFVGVAVPHLIRRLLNTSRPLLTIPACFLGGGGFCLFCDLIARSVFAPAELSISTVTAILGAPVVILLLARRVRR